MEGKLIFDRDNQYTLIVNDNIFSSTNAFRIAENEYWLCINNCEAIKRGYDLDELAKSVPHTCRNDEDWYKCRAGFIEGFQKALELLSDKKFTEQDVKKIIHWSTLDRDVRLSEEELFQSLQQNEWRVIIEMEKYGFCEGCRQAGMWHCAHADTCGNAIELERPKLDSKGKLILKLKS